MAKKASFIPESLRVWIEARIKQPTAKKQEKREAKLQRKSEEVTKDDALRVESKNQILFLCTWNYYRSRFAEIYFNWEAAAANIGWRADSRGLALPESIPNTLSKYTIDYLARLAIPYDTLRKPMDATEEDFAKADRVIAIKRAEHQPIIQKRFETFADRVEYWDIHDIDASTPEEQLPLLHAQVRSLITDLAYA